MLALDDFGLYETGTDPQTQEWFDHEILALTEDDPHQPLIDLPIQEWLDRETSDFIENELSEAADCYHQWLAEICGSDDLFDVGLEMRVWWNNQVYSFRSELLRSWRIWESAARNEVWHEDFELESRRQLAYHRHEIDLY